MKRFLKKRFLLSLLFLFGAFLFLRTISDLHEETFSSATVERGTVQQTISVSGFLEADQLAELSFPQPNRLSSLEVSEGDQVKAGDLLATAGNGAAAAERNRALAQLLQAEAARDKILNGLTLEARAVSSTTVAQARAALERTEASEQQKIAVARADLLSTDLTALAEDEDDETVAPTISGSYTCEDEGEYEFEIYRSDTRSGFSIRYDGLESGVAPVSFNQPVALGNCGLLLQFSDIKTYNTSTWTISVPNIFSDSYIQRLRAYELVQEQAEQNINAATYAVELASNQATSDTAAPRVEAVLEANAAVAAAQADVAKATALLRDDAIYAPFDGTITSITTTVGETANGPVLSLVASDAYTLVARVPEIDIRRLEAAQRAQVSFDAASGEVIPALVSYVSPVATVIDGVSYFETNLELTDTPDWLRDGLNADIDIIIEERTKELRIPNRFIFDTGTGPEVLLLGKDNSRTTTSVDVVLQGTDGYSVINGLSEGDTVVASQ